MRWLGSGLIGSVGAAVLLSTHPWYLDTVADGTTSRMSSMTVILAWFFILATISGTVVIGLEPESAIEVRATRAALGESNRRAGIAAARRGAAAGAIVSAILIVPSSVAVLLSSRRGSGGAWGWIALVAGLVFLSILVSHVVAANAPKREPVTEALRHSHETRPFRIRAIRWYVLIGFVVSLPSAIVRAVSDGGSIWSGALLLVVGTASAGLVGVLIEWGIRWGIDLAPVAMARLARRGRGPVATLLADEALARRRPRGAGILTAIAVIAALIAGTALVSSRSIDGREINIVIGDVWRDGGEPCVGSCIEEFRQTLADEPIVGAIVPAITGRLVGGDCVGEVYAVDPALAGAADPVFARVLRSELDTIETEHGTCGLDFDGNWIDAPVAYSPGSGIVLIADANTVTAQDDTLVPNALLVYAADPNEQSLDIVVDTVAERLGLEYVAPVSMTRVENVVDGGMSVPLALTAFALLLIVPLAALVVAGVAERRRDHGTLAALGATTSTLRTAMAIESTFRAWAAVIVGMLAGLLVRLVVIGYSAIAGSSDDSIGTGSGDHLDSIPWSALGIAAAAALGAIALISAIAAASISRATPVEALRPEPAGSGTERRSR
ncbi:MAG: hypothetical protein JW722_02810 [Demequinaceae bacterium]|nr:hypothetical protein [Demequinaceae bacterium]